jgi:hypothetical protein
VISWVAEVPYLAAAVHSYYLYVLLGFQVEDKPAAVDVSRQTVKMAHVSNNASNSNSGNSSCELVSTGAAADA